MYGLYQVEEIDNQSYLRFESEVHLAGCNVGLIPRHLSELITPDVEAPYKWALRLKDIYGIKREAIVIDFKPRAKDQILMGELTHVFGYSFPGTDDPWTPILLRLKMIADINDPVVVSSFNKELILYEDFVIVYTMGHLKGSIQKGKIVGKWTPGFGSLNSLILWKDILAYFVECVKKTDSDFLSL
jgi:hypothetical protein